MPFRLFKAGSPRKTCWEFGLWLVSSHHKVTSRMFWKVTALLIGGYTMKKSFRMLVGTIILGAAVAAASVSHNRPASAGADPVPACPPGGCLIN